MRLLEGVHKNLGRIGADHLQLKNELGDTIDATYLDASKVVKKLQEMGGEKVKFKINETSLEFPGYCFDKKSSQFKEVLNQLTHGVLRWGIIEVDDKIFLMKDVFRDEDKELIKQQYDVGQLIMVKTAPGEHKKGTVLMSTNQTDCYEQRTHEILAMALDGINVMVYNNVGKGLSTSGSYTPNTRDHINQAIETCYRYLRNIKKIPDDQILAKGQCFGAAPTAWLGKEHPKINIMLDQAPSSFVQVAANYMKRKVGIKDKSKWGKFCRLIKLDQFVDWVARAVIMGYDTPGNLRENKGNVLFHFNLPGPGDDLGEGVGGDNLVTNTQISTLDQVYEDTRKPDYSFNLGGEHCKDDWFFSLSSYDSVMSFMKKINLVSDFFEETPD